jgi:hypothetical protein
MLIQLPYSIKIQRKHLQEFIECERGAQEDDITGPSPITTVSILERHKTKIVVNTVEEAAQILNCCYYGTFPKFFESVAMRIATNLKNFADVKMVYDQYNQAEFADLLNLIKERFPQV